VTSMAILMGRSDEIRDGISALKPKAQ
jgi:hypothetical protein